MSELPDGTRWQRVEALFDEAFELEDAEREAHVRARCPDDPELAAEVLALLAETTRPGPLDQPIAELTQAAARGGDSVGTGRKVGAWRLAEPLGSGGMGRVFAAQREGGDFEQEAAVKLLRWEVASPDLVERFRTERRILAGLDHPGIARLIDGGITDEGVPFLVMERVDGQPIDRYCAERKLPLRQRLELFLEVCEAVQSAHTQLVIHRDLKPSNILVASDGQIRLVDFGVAKLLEADPAGGASLTLEGIAPATPTYAAPEQLEGRPMSVATDVYGLGTVLFELLTGRRPFEPMGASPLEIARRVVETEPPAPSRSAQDRPTQYRPVAPGLLRGDLDNVVLEALAKEPAERYRSVDHLAADLRKFLAGRPVEASSPTPLYRAKKFALRHRAASALALVLLVGGVLGAAGITRQSRIAQQQAAKAQATADFLEQTLMATNLETDEAGGLSVEALLERAEPRVDEELADFPEVRARVRQLLARAFHGVGRAQDSLRLHRVAYEEATEHFGPESPDAAWALVGIALNDDEAPHDDRLEWFGQALATLRNVHGPRSVAAGEVLNLMGQARVEAGQFAEAEVDYREALDISTELFGEEHPSTASVQANLGSLLRRLERHEEAIELQRKALASYVSQSGAETFYSLAIRNNLALSLATVGRLDEAEAEYRKTAELKRQKLGDRHPSLGQTLTNLGRLLMDQGRFTQAEAPVREAADILRASLPETDFSRIASKINLASLRLELGQRRDAIGLYRAAHATFTQRLGEGHSATARVGWLLAEAQRQQGRLAEARTLLDALPTSGAPIDELRSADRLLTLGRLELDSGRNAQAGEALSEALETYQRHWDNDHWRVVETAAELVLASATSAAERRRQLAPLASRLREKLPADNWRLDRLAAHLEP